MNTYFKYAQVATDFSSLQNKCLPTNLDGITERNGHFLVIECKHGNEQPSGGQAWMLRAFGGVPKFTVLIVHCEHVEADEKRTRPFIPVSYSIVTADCIQLQVPTSIEDFRQRYQKWLDNSELGAKAFEQESKQWEA
jgi:hypothetical protein